MTITTLLAAGREPWEAGLVAAAARTPGLVLVRRCVDVADAVATAATGEVRLALLSLDLPGLDADVVDRVAASGVIPIGVVAPDGDHELTRATALGMRAVVTADRLDGLSSLVDEVAQSHEQADSESGAGPGQVIAVWGPTGAPGRSTVALGIASETALAGVPTLLIDADVYGGAIAQMLAILDEVSGVLAVARTANSGRLGLEEFVQHTRRVDTNLSVLTGLPRADRWPGLRVGAFRAVLDRAREFAAVVVVDVGFSLEVDESSAFDSGAPRRNGATIVALEHADRVVVVGSADSLGLTRLTRGVFDLRDSVPGVDVSIVVNKVRRNLGWSAEQIAETVRRFTGYAPLRYLPMDQSAVDAAWLNGRALAECAPDSMLRRELSALAKQLTVRDYVPASRRRRSWWARARSAAPS